MMQQQRRQQRQQQQRMGGAGADGDGEEAAGVVGSTETEERWRRASLPVAVGFDPAAAVSARLRRTSVNAVASDYYSLGDQCGYKVHDLTNARRKSVQLWLDMQDDAEHILQDSSRPFHLTTALLANISAQQRRGNNSGVGGAPRSSGPDRRLSRVRKRIKQIIESNAMQMLTISLVLVEMFAVIFEVLLEVCWLSFDPNLRMPGGPTNGTSDIDATVISALHYTSVTILSFFQLEFAFLFFAVGFKFCCRPLLLLDVLIVSAALATELYMHGYLMESGKRCKEIDDSDESRLTWQIIFVVTLRVIRIVHALFTQFQRHEERIERATRELAELMERRYRQREGGLVVDCDLLRAEVKSASALACEWQERGLSLQAHCDDLELLVKVQQSEITELRSQLQGPPPTAAHDGKAD